MRRNRVLGIVGLWLGGAILPAWADEPVLIPFNPPSRPVSQAVPAQGRAQQPPPPEPEPPPDLSAQAQPEGPSGSSNPGAGHPQMVGDLNGGTFVRRLLTFPTNVTLQVSTSSFDPGTNSFITTNRNVIVPSNITREVNVALSALGAYKVGENEGVQPTDRVFATYNCFNNVAILRAGPDSIPPIVTQVNAGAFNSSVSSRNAGSSYGPSPPPIVEQTTVSVVSFNGAPARNSFDAHREVFGFEKTLFCHDFSVEVRLPLYQQTGAPEFETSRFGDVSVLGKYAMINDEETGTVLSGGLMLTVPTGEDVIAIEGTQIHSTLLQPFVGYFANLGSFYFQGFSAVIVPTDSRDSTLLTEDVGVGYRLYEDESGSNLVRYLIPAVEGHLTTPLNNRGALDSPAGFPDIFVATGAVHIGLGDRGSLTMGVGAPLTGPQPFDVEGVVQLNLRF